MKSDLKIKVMQETSESCVKELIGKEKELKTLETEVEALRDCIRELDMKLEVEKEEWLMREFGDCIEVWDY